MTRTNYALKRWIRAAIYRLKKEYGGDITIYEQVSAATNLANGTKTATYNSYVINRAVVLPIHAVRSVIQTISLISANKKLVQGGTFDSGDRLFLIDRGDVPSTLSLERDDWILYDGHRYDLKYIEDYEPSSAWLVLGKMIEGVTPEVHIRTYPKTNFTLTTSVANDDGDPSHALSLSDTASAVLE